MKKITFFAFLLGGLSLGFAQQNQSNLSDIELQELEANTQMKTTYSSEYIAKLASVDNTISKAVLSDLVPTAGATETFSPVAGDFFFDPGGPGGSETDGDPGNYPNCDCITTSTLSGVTELTFDTFLVFANFDWIKIYDGADVTGTVLYDNGPSGAQDGDITLADMTASVGSTTFSGTSGDMTLEFRASGVVNREGFQISFPTAGGGFPAPYCEVTGGTSDIEPISQVTFAGIDNASDPVVDASPLHEDFTAIEGTVEQDETYDITLNGNTGGNFTNSFAVFIDWNQNEVLDDAGEAYLFDAAIVNTDGTVAADAFIGSIAVPADALDGATRMRVNKKFGSTATADPCALGSSFGQSEDYTIVVGAAGGVANDDCADAIDIACDETVTGSTTDATDSGSNASPDVWYSYSGDAGTITASLCDGGTDYDSLLRVFDACDGTEIATNDDACGLQSEVSFVADGTTTYYIMVEGFSSDFGNFSLALTCDLGGGGGDDVECVQTQASNAFEDGRGCDVNSNWTTANDYIVLTGTNAELNSITPNIFMNVGATVVSADVTILEDNAGLPGAIVETQAAVVPTSHNVVGTNFGFDISEVVIDLSTVFLAGDENVDTNYWIAIQVTTSDGGPAYWENSTASAIGAPHAFDDGTGYIYPEATQDGVYTFDAVCSPILGLADSAIVDYTIFPNPASNSINLRAAYSIENIVISNVLGQQVMANKGGSNELTLDIANLQVGTYFMKATVNGIDVVERFIKK